MPATLSKFSESAELFIRAARALFYGSSLFGLAFACNLAQLTTLLVLPFSVKRMYDLNSRLAGGVWWVMQCVFEKRHRAKITYSGDAIPEKESALVIANHQSFVDFYLVHSLAMRRGILSYCKYFAKDSLKYIPFFGWGMWLMGMMYIKRNWIQDRRAIDGMFNRVRRYESPIWLISYLEGTRVSPSKLLESEAFARERGLPILKNVLLPRTKGFCECVRQLRGTHVKHVYDLTFVYRHKKLGVGHAPSLARVHTGRLDTEYDFHVHTRRFLLEDLPEGEAELNAWAFKVYAEKDAYIEEKKKRWEDGEVTHTEPWF